MQKIIFIYLYRIIDREYILIDEITGQHVEINGDKLDKCYRKDNKFICWFSQVMENSMITNCVAELFLKHEQQNHKICTQQIIKIQDELWLHLENPNKIIFIIHQNNGISVNCNNTEKFYNIKNRGIITLDNKCILKSKTIIINTNKSNKTIISEQFLKAGINNIEVMNFKKE